MKNQAVCYHSHGDPEVLVLEEIDLPVIGKEVLIEMQVHDPSLRSGVNQRILRTVA